jgi:hypothetical protein
VGDRALRHSGEGGLWFGRASDRCRAANGSVHGGAGTRQTARKKGVGGRDLTLRRRGVPGVQTTSPRARRGIHAGELRRLAAGCRAGCAPRRLAALVHDAKTWGWGGDEVGQTCCAGARARRDRWRRFPFSAQARQPHARGQREVAFGGDANDIWAPRLRALCHRAHGWELGRAGLRR